MHTESTQSEYDQSALGSNEPAPEEPSTNPALDEDILNILGEDPNKKTYDVEIHKDITARWSHITTNGLEKETKTELGKKYLLPENCQFLEPPKINPEIKAAVSDQVLKRDQALEMQQNYLGQATACIGKALNILVMNSKEKGCIEATTVISDAGRMLCDLFHKESMSRRHLLQFALNKHTKDIVANTKVGKHLFGENLAEELKAGKAVNKTGVEIKYNKPQPKPTATLNYRGPPRKYQPQQQTPSAGRQPPYNRQSQAKPAPQRRPALQRRGAPSHRKI